MKLPTPPPLSLIAACAAWLVLAMPVQAHAVLFRDGTSVNGLALLKENSVTVRGAGAELSFPLEVVRSISLGEDGIVWVGVLAAEPAIVVPRLLLKDGRSVIGTIRSEPTGLMITGAGGQSEEIAYDQIQGISLDGTPLLPDEVHAEGRTPVLLWTTIMGMAAGALITTAVFRFVSVHK